jgi:hypothetical protein
MANHIVKPEMIDTESEWFSESAKAFHANFYGEGPLVEGLRAVFSHIANNPIKPTPEQSSEVADAIFHINPTCTYAAYATEWQRRMFLRREPKVPAEVKALLWEMPANGIDERSIARQHNEAVLAAVELGKKIGGAQ